MRKKTRKKAAKTKRRKPSPLEDRFVQLAGEHDWGEYEREKRGLVPGRRFRCDFYFPAMKLVVEIDGVGGRRSGHCTAVGVTRDREKDSLLQLHGYRVLRFTTYHFTKSEGCRYIIDAMDEAVRQWGTT